MKPIFKDLMPLIVALMLVYGAYITAALAWPSAWLQPMFDMWALAFGSRDAALFATTMTNLIVCSLLMAAFMWLFGVRIQKMTDKWFN